MKFEVYPKHKFLFFTNPTLHTFIKDFVSYTIDLPKEFYDIGLDSDGYEAVFKTAPAGSLTPPGVYKNLIEYMRNFYNVDKAIEIWPPRSCTKIMDAKPQMFAKYGGSSIKGLDRPIITVFPRARERASNRNVPEYVWKELIDNLKRDFLIVLAGTPKGACLHEYKDPSVNNLILYNELDKTDQVIGYLNNSICSISSQSGGTHISLLSDCPSYIIGHENYRHTIYENRYNTPTSFRYVSDYRAIDTQTILKDVAEFIYLLQKEKAKLDKKPEDRLQEDIDKMNEMIRG